MEKSTWVGGSKLGRPYRRQIDRQVDGVLMVTRYPKIKIGDRLPGIGSIGEEF